MGGTVVWPDGRPAVEAIIGIQGKNPSFEIMERSTDAEGRFQIGRIPAVESALLTARAVRGDATFQVQVDAELNRTDHVLTLEPQGELPNMHPVARVLGPGGGQVEHCEAWIYYSRDGKLSRTNSQRAGLTEGEVRAWLPHERVQVWHEMTRTLLDEMDRQLDAAIKEGLYAYLLL